MPVVQRRILVFDDRLFSSLMEYPDVSPTRSHRSDATRSDTPIAEMRLGWVTIMLASAPKPLKIMSSRTSCGTCVVCKMDFLSQEKNEYKERPLFFIQD